MMKKIWLIVLVLIPFLVRGQAIVQPIGAPNVRIRAQGTIGGDSGIYIGSRDTTFTPTVQNTIVVRPQDGVAYMFQTHWNPLGQAVWGRIGGTLSSQADLVAALAAKQGSLTNGYGWVLNGSAGTFDSAHVRKVDTMFRVNDSTIGYKINGISYSALIRGTAAGGINSLVLTVPTVLFSSPVTFTNSGGSWTGTIALQLQNANTGLFGPVTGSAATPTMRAMVIADLPTNIPNSNLANSVINLTLDNTTTTVGFSASSVQLGNGIVLHVPFASATSNGQLSLTDWNRFNTSISPVISVNGQVGAVSVRNADSLGNYPIDFTNFHNGWVLAVDTITSTLVFQAPGAGSGITSLNGLNPTTQFFVISNGGVPNASVGTSPNVVSATATHAFNFPIANGADTGVVTPGQVTAWNAKISDSGFNVLLQRASINVPVQKVIDGSGHRLIVVDTSITNPGGIMTRAGNQKTVDSTLSVVNASLATKITGAGNYSPLFNTGLSGSTITFIPPTISPYTFWGNGTGSSAAPGFGSVPYQAFASISNNSLYGSNGSGTPAVITAGTNITISGGAISAAGGGGTDSGYSQFLYTNLSSFNAPLWKVISGAKRLNEVDTIPTDPDAMVLQYQLTNGLNGINNTVSNDRSDAASDSLMYFDISGNAHIRGVQDTSTDGSVTITKTLATNGTVINNFHVSTGGSSPPFNDGSANPLMQNTATTSKKLAFDLTNQTASTTILDSFPTASQMLAGLLAANRFQGANTFDLGINPTVAHTAFNSVSWGQFKGDGISSTGVLGLGSGGGLGIVFTPNGSVSLQAFGGTQDWFLTRSGTSGVGDDSKRPLHVNGKTRLDSVLALNNVAGGSGTPQLLVHMPDSSVAQVALGANLSITGGILNAAGGGATLTRQSITSGTSATGTTITSGKLIVTFNFTTTVSAFAFTFPASAFDGEEVVFESGGSLSYPAYEVTTMTELVNSGQTGFGQTVVVTTLQANEGAAWTYNISLGLWMRTR